MITDTVIKWHQVNMRVENKELPEQHSRIVYYDAGICVGIVSTNSKNKLCVNDYNARNSKDIKTGFTWCYQSDIKQPEEI